MSDVNVDEVVEINIRLQQSERYGRGPGTVDVGDVILRLQSLAVGGLVAVRISMVGEPTLILRFIPNVTRIQFFGFIHRTAAALLVECIAMYFPRTDTGLLSGPYAKDNGSFSRAFFQRI